MCWGKNCDIINDYIYSTINWELCSPEVLACIDHQFPSCVYVGVGGGGIFSVKTDCDGCEVFSKVWSNEIPL